MPQTTVFEESVMIKPSVQTILCIVCMFLIISNGLFEDHLRVIIRNGNSTLFNSIVLYNVYFDTIAQKI